MKLRKVMALTLAGAMTAATLTACGGGADETTAAAAGADKETTAAAEDKETTAAAADSGSADAEVVLQVAFENSHHGARWRGLDKGTGDHQREIRRKDGH